MKLRDLTWALIISGAGASCGDDDSGTSAVDAGVDGAAQDASRGGARDGEVDAGDGGSAPVDPQPPEGLCFVSEPADNTCPSMPAPVAGDCAPHGPCCGRSSNEAKLAVLGPDDPLILEYRINESIPANHPCSIGQALLRDLAVMRAELCSGEQCNLWRFTEPRRDGEFVEGAGRFEIGIGRYNCDGTFSYYGDDAAPDREGRNDRGRWRARSLPTSFDPSRDDIERHGFAFDDLLPQRELTCSPFLDLEDPTQVDWELCTSGTAILSMDFSDRDCVGSWDGLDYQVGGRFVTYAPLPSNAGDVLNETGADFNSLLAFGLVGSDISDPLVEERCLPDPPCADDSSGICPCRDTCPWIKLPDSLCPDTDAEREIFGCHLGDRDNVNDETDYPGELACSLDRPTTPRDEDAPDEGQCCDPLGRGTDGLPPCNAYRILNDYVAAAVQITDDPRDEIPPLCP